MEERIQENYLDFWSDLPGVLFCYGFLSIKCPFLTAESFFDHRPFKISEVEYLKWTKVENI